MRQDVDKKSIRKNCQFRGPQKHSFVSKSGWDYQSDGPDIVQLLISSFAHKICTRNPRGGQRNNISTG